MLDIEDNIHAPNFEEIRNMTTGNYHKFPNLAKIEPKTGTLGDLSQKQLAKKLKQEFSGIYQSPDSLVLGSKTIDTKGRMKKLPKLFGGQVAQTMSLTKDKNESFRNLDAKVKVKKRNHNGMLQTMNAHSGSRSFSQDPVMALYTTAHR